jgi:hypothetical protein
MGGTIPQVTPLMLVDDRTNAAELTRSGKCRKNAPRAIGLNPYRGGQNPGLSKFSENTGKKLDRVFSDHSHGSDYASLAMGDGGARKST